jgi:hypothetical protein
MIFNDGEAADSLDIVYDDVAARQLCRERIALSAIVS